MNSLNRSHWSTSKTPSYKFFCTFAQISKLAAYITFLFLFAEERRAESKTLST